MDYKVGLGLSKDPETFEEAIDQVLGEMREVMIRKNRDYASAKADNISEFGELGVLVRANDKLSRLKNLLWHSKHEPKNESIEDSWIDLGNYCVISLLVRRGLWGKRLKEDVEG